MAAGSSSSSSSSNSGGGGTWITTLFVGFLLGCISVFGIVRINPTLQGIIDNERSSHGNDKKATGVSNDFGVRSIHTERRQEEEEEEKIVVSKDNDNQDQQREEKASSTSTGTTSSTITTDDSSTGSGYDPSKTMNVVLFYADDWSFTSLGALGNDYVQTPVLDEMAKNGVLFTHNCVVTSVCMQSRATLYTGQYSSRHKTYFAYRNNTMYNEWDTTLYPQMKKAGYYVGFFGKYHHLENWPKDIPTFDERIMYQGSHYVKRGNEIKHITEWNEIDGINFLNNRPKDQPFFMTVSFFATHAEDGSMEQYRPMNSSMSMYVDTPVPHPKTYTEQHWNELPHFFNERNFGRARFMKRYKTHDMYQHHMKNTYRMVTEVDTAIGRMMDKLKEQNVLDQTFIIFTTDNGNLHGQHGMAEKWYAYEESLRVPLIIQDPRLQKRGQINTEFTLNIDLAPTILSAVGVTPPDVMQGRDMAELYINHVHDWRKEFIYEFWDDNPDIHNSIAVVQKDFKYIWWTDYNYKQYFNLTHDPYEEFDLYDVTDKDVLEQIHARLELHELYNLFTHTTMLYKKQKKKISKNKIK